MMRKRGIALLFLSIIVFQFCFAKDPVTLKFDFISEVGMTMMSNTQLDSYLETQGFYKTPKDEGLSTISIGFRMRDSTSHVMADFLYIKSEYDNRGNVSKINSHGYQINLLYNLSSNSKWVFAPKLSLILSDYNLSALSTISNSNLSGQKLEEGFAVKDAFDLQIGPSVERKFVIMRIPFSFGLNVYYNFALGKYNWENLNGDHLKAMPPLNSNGFGFKFRVGVALNYL